MGTGLTVPAEFEPGHSDAERARLLAVHFLRFAFSEPAVRAFRDSPVALVVDHRGGRRRTELSAETKAALLEDLAP